MRTARAPTGTIKAVVLESGVFFNRSDYLQEGESKEIVAIGRALGLLNPEATQRRIEERRAELVSQRDGRAVTTPDVLRSLTLTPEWLRLTRERCYRPEKFFTPERAIITVVRALAEVCTLIMVSDLPRSITTRSLGVTSLRPYMKVVWGPEDGDAERLAERLLSPFSECALVSGEDSVPPIAGAFGALYYVTDLVKDLDEIARQLASRETRR